MHKTSRLHSAKSSGASPVTNDEEGLGFQNTFYKTKKNQSATKLLEINSPNEDPAFSSL